MYNTNEHHTKDLPSTIQLLRSTIIAILVALFILIAFVLPAEYGIDPTGIGGTLWLKEMGRIKVSLQEEIDAEEKRIEQQEKDKNFVEITEEVLPLMATGVVEDQSTSGDTQSTVKSDTLIVTVWPDKSTELKLDMMEGQTIQYTWAVDVWYINYNIHGEWDLWTSHEYGEALKVSSDSWSLTAKFDGKHGWFFRNRFESDVTITITVTWDYQSFTKLF